MKNNNKVTLNQLKRMLTESILSESEEVLVVTPSGEELGVLDDEGHFQAGGYPRYGHDCGEYVDYEGYYAKKCGMYDKMYGYDPSKEDSDGGTRGSSVFLIVAKGPKDEAFSKICMEYAKAFKEKKDSTAVSNGWKGEPDKIAALDAARTQLKEAVKKMDPFCRSIKDGNWNIAWKSNLDGTLLFRFKECKSTRGAFVVDQYGRISEHPKQSVYMADYCLDEWWDTTEKGGE